LPLRVKWIAISMMGAWCCCRPGNSMGRPWLQGTVLALGLVGGWVVWRIPTRR
jgi:hypothetical protein